MANAVREFYALGVRETLQELGTAEAGLSPAEAQKRLTQYGANELPKEKGTTVIKLFLNQFANALVLLLIFAGSISIFLGEKIESIAIFSIVLINALLGFVQEYKAERSMEALERISAPTARVLREGKAAKIAARELVPGDILLLEEGDIIPADARLLTLASLQVEESSLTGESVPSKKGIGIHKLGTQVADQENMVFMGTVITYGKGTAVVTATGINTEFGKIAKTIQATPETKTPLQVKFEELAKQIGVVAIVLIALVLITGTLRGEATFAKMLLFALVLAVATIPSALPVIVTVSLSMGAKRLAKQNMLIKKLPAAEALGAVTVICSDKTGTITKNEMTITHLYVSGTELTVTGAGYAPDGDFFLKEKAVDPKSFELLLRIGHTCNNAKLTEHGGKYLIVGDPTEGSCLVLARKAKLSDEYFHAHYPRIAELPFDSDRKSMTVVCTNKKDKTTEAYVKGAPDLLLDRCTRIWENGKVRKLTKQDREHILHMNLSFGERALRVLAFAYREATEKTYSIERTENDLTFVGLVGMIDPPRDEVRLAVEECRAAGIRMMIITGDHAVTTRAIAQQIGMLKHGDIVLNGNELEAMSNAELAAKIDQIAIIARALPIQKSRIVDALQAKGHIVAMTGDGVNDAPALKKADIGVAMGITGTDVSKEVAKAILVDDNFATIVRAVKEGRNIYDKMIKSAKYLLSCNAGEIGTILFAILAGFPLPLLPLQVLMINLLTDSFPAVGLGFETSEDGIMQRPPRNPNEKPITFRMFLLIMVFGIIMSIGTLYMFQKLKNSDLPHAQTLAFTTSVMFQMFAVVSSRSLHPSLRKLNPFSNLWLLGGIVLAVGLHIAVVYLPPLQYIFGTVALSGVEWVEILLVASLGFILMEIGKWVFGEGRTATAI